MLKTTPTATTDNPARRQFFRLSLGLALVASLPLFSNKARSETATKFPIQKTPEQWRVQLSSAQYAVLREEDTEAPNTSPFLQEKRAGIFHCAGCDNALYDNSTKFESGTGWPSFYQAVDGGVGTKEDNGFFMKRTEVHCADCGGHLGHIFDDGPQPTGLRHCINGVALTFKPKST